MAEAKNAFLSNLPVVVAGTVAILAAGAWIVFWMSPEEGPTRAPKPVEAKAGKTDAVPPLRALPPPGTDLLPPARTLPPEPAPSQQAAAPVPAPPVKVAPALPVTAAAPAAEKTSPAPTAKRAEKAPVESTGVSVLAGRYVGNIRGSETAGLTLVIASVEGGVAKGTASVAGSGPCDDTYPVQGSARGGKLELRATRMGGRASDCPLSLSLAVDGARLTGATGSGGAVQLSRR